MPNIMIHREGGGLELGNDGLEQGYAFIDVSMIT